MKKIIIIILLKVVCFNSLGQIIFRSEDGAIDGLFPIDTIRALNIFVNIIYDTDPTANPDSSMNGLWSYSTSPGINISGSMPTYLNEFIDTAYFGPENTRGTLTRKYCESSFGNFIILGEHICINVSLNGISGGASFGHSRLFTHIIDSINSAGGLDSCALNGYTNIADFCSHGDTLDFMQIMIRNPCNTYGGSFLIKGRGLASYSTSERLLVGGIFREIGAYTMQNVGSGDISKAYTGVAVHELSHLLFGGNSFHTSGGDHYRTFQTNVFLGLQYGFGLMGGSSSLVSCNAYDRWRMNWRGLLNNANRIAANNISSDIDSSSGHIEFLLRDFVTFGDAIRIRLPYKDSAALTQYIWLENHQLDSSNLDFLSYADGAVRTKGQPGIYAYYQIGKDSVESTNINDVWPSGQMDNLKIISAEGNWDIEYVGDTMDYRNWGIRPIGKYMAQNPLCGANDQMQFFDMNTSASVIDNTHKAIGIKIKNGDTTNMFHWLGDNDDAFVDRSVMDIGTNPAPVNTLTFHARQMHSGGSIAITPLEIDQHNRTIYLSGLSIKMFEDGGENDAGNIFRVVIDWDDYDIKKDCRWTGNIVLQERANLMQDKFIEIDQCYNPIQRDRDTISNQFAPYSVFTCREGSEFTMQENSKVIVKNNSSFILEAGSDLVIGNDAEFIVRSGSVLEIHDSTSVIVNGRGKIIVECGGQICVAPTADIQLNDINSRIKIYRVETNGETWCLTNLNTVISGQGQLIIVDGIAGRLEIQDTTYTTEQSEIANTIIAVNNVAVETGADVIFDAEGGVELPKNFEVKLNSVFKIENNSYRCK